MNYEKLYVDGQWTDTHSKEFIDVENPATEEKFAQVPAGDKEDVNQAVAAAKRAFKVWQSTSLQERLAYLSKGLEIFQTFQDELTEIEVSELGSPMGRARKVHVESPMKSFEKFIKIAPDFSFEEALSRSTVRKEPVGVVGCLTPWNYPLDQVIKKVIPALICGNTVVLKPSQNTPLSVYWLAESFHQAQLPKGVFNLVTGRGAEVGNVLASHPDVDMISFTGSTTGGKEVGKLAMETVKKITLELGGKSANLVLHGADYEMAVTKSLNSTFYNTGQTCAALSRLIVPKEDLEKIEALIVDKTPHYKVGDPRDEGTDIGPLASKKQFDKVKHYVEMGVSEGAQLLVGKIPEKESAGYFVDPVVFTKVSNDMTIAQDEIFGPVLCVIPYDGIDEGLRIANDSMYGLSGAVFGPQAEAEKAAAALRTGSVYVNDGRGDPLAPFGGYKQSGIGREGGFYGLEEFVEIKSFYNQ